MRLRLLAACLIGALAATACTQVSETPSSSVAVLATPAATTAPLAANPPEPTLRANPTPVNIPTPVPPTPVPPTVVPATAVPATAIPAAAVPAQADAPSNVATPPTSTTAAPITGSQAALAANGAEVYTLNCARCHAENGLGTARYGGLIHVGSKYSTAGMIQELTTGHPVTFGFADRLSAEEIASVVAYVKSAFP